MKVIDIVYEWLEQNGYDGLVDVDNECGCQLSDLAPCEMLGQDCEAGYKRIVGNRPQDFIITTVK